MLSSPGRAASGPTHHRRRGRVARRRGRVGRAVPANGATIASAEGRGSRRGHDRHGDGKCFALALLTTRARVGTCHRSLPRIPWRVKSSPNAPKDPGTASVICASAIHLRLAAEQATRTVSTHCQRTGASITVSSAHTPIAGIHFHLACWRQFVWSRCIFMPPLSTRALAHSTLRTIDLRNEFSKSMPDYWISNCNTSSYRVQLSPVFLAFVKSSDTLAFKFPSTKSPTQQQQGHRHQYYPSHQTHAKGETANLLKFRTKLDRDAVLTNLNAYDHLGY